MLFAILWEKNHLKNFKRMSIEISRIVVFACQNQPLLTYNALSL